MFEFLFAMFVFPIWFPLMFGLLFVTFFALYIKRLYDDSKWNPERNIFVKARKKGIPVIRKHALNGFFQFVLGEKEKKGDPMWKFDKDTNEGIRFDPRLQSGSVPKSFTRGGLEMLDYSTSSPFALSMRNALGMKTVLKYARENHPVLAIFSDQLVLEYVGRNRADLPHDCTNLAETYDLDIEFTENDLAGIRDAVTKNITDDPNSSTMKPEDKEEAIENGIKQYILDYKRNTLVRTFQDIQDKAMNIPIQTDVFFSFPEAFQNISTAFSAVDIQTFLQLFERIAQLKNELDMKWLATLCIAGGMGVLMILVGAYIFTRAS